MCRPSSATDWRPFGGRTREAHRRSRNARSFSRPRQGRRHRHGECWARPGIGAERCASLPHLIQELDQGAGLVVVTEEALAAADLAPLAAWITDQEQWSDLPFVLLTSHGGGLERNPAAGATSPYWGNVTFIERPFHPTTLVSLAHSALRGRRRQYEARARLQALHESEDHYRHTVKLNPQVPWTATPDGLWDHVSERWFEWTGMQGLGGDLGCRPARRRSSANLRSMGRSVATGQPYEVNIESSCGTGSHRWARSCAYPRRTPKVASSSGMAQPRKSTPEVAEAELSASEAKLQAIATLSTR